MRFWLVFAAFCTSCFLSALDLTAVSTALPSIAEEFNSNDSSWIGSSYALASTALIPWTGGLAYIFGRRPVLLIALVTFAAGSAITGAGKSMGMAVAGRTILGMGGGAVLTMTEIVVVDLVPIAERGSWLGVLGAVRAGASALGPPVGGALASAGAWRWLFYLHLPLAGLAMVLVACFLDVKAPKTTRKQKLEQMDFVNLLFVAGSTATILAITWGGTTYSWTSYKILVPLVGGIIAMAVFVWLEKSHVKVPTLPYEILEQRTSLLGFVTTFLHGILVMFGVYYIPVYYQSCFGDSAIMSEVHLFSLLFTVAPLAVIIGISIALSGHYRWQNLAGWAVLTVGFLLMSTSLDYDAPESTWVPVCVIVGCGAGILFSSTNFVVLAPLTPAQQPHGMALYGFFRSFGQVVGVAVGGSVLQNKLDALLPTTFAGSIGGSGAAIAAIPLIKKLDEPLRALVRTAFADSLRLLWQIGIGISAVAFPLSFLIQSITLSTVGDEENWGLMEEKDEKVRVGRV